MTVSLRCWNGSVEQAGRAEVLGRPMTFRTTELFEYFGLKDLEDLPAADELSGSGGNTSALTSEEEESPAEAELSDSWTMSDSPSKVKEQSLLKIGGWCPRGS